MIKRHVVVGAGNLGHSIHAACPGGSYLASHWRYPTHPVREILDSEPDYVWCCIGGGSVNEAKSDFARVLQAHLNIPLEFAMFLPEKTRLVAFSTDYVADEEDPSNPQKRTAQCKSLYARTKLLMEETLSQLPNSGQIRIVRVGSLYGRNFPKKSFPGRLMGRFIENGAGIKLPMNRVTPTSTEWIADTLHRHLDGLFEAPGVVHHLAPRGNWTVADWGRRVLPPTARVDDGDIDAERPQVSDLGCDWTHVDTLEDIYRLYPPRIL